MEKVTIKNEIKKDMKVSVTSASVENPSSVEICSPTKEELLLELFGFADQSLNALHSWHPVSKIACCNVDAPKGGKLLLDLGNLHKNQGP